MLHFEHRKFAAVSPGNLGSDWLMQYAEEAGLGEQEKTRFRESIVASSNFIGKTVDMAGELGFSGLLLAGHIGKLVKLGNGIMDTHSGFKSLFVRLSISTLAFIPPALLSDFPKKLICSLRFP